jgi:23S rRNA (guanine2445-N2)-methyltransferase / 23S rRNA (guanine2069-N7)-methyltransferase
MLSSVPAVQRTVKKAIVERLQQAHARVLLPETGGEVRAEVALLHDVATITLETSGDGLHKRGYRPVVGAAALKETLAAGLVQLSVWQPSRALVDPFCGSGTIAIEAAMLARNIAPGRRRGFACERWASFPSGVWERAREEAEAAPRGELAMAIHASDIDERAVALTRRAAMEAGVERDVHCKVQAFEQLRSTQQYGSIITNPPYGMRLGDDERELAMLYRSMPMVFKGLTTWSFHILTGRLDLEEMVGQQASRRRKLYNSQIECTYFTFLGPKPPREMRAEQAQPIQQAQRMEQVDDTLPGQSDEAHAGEVSAHEPQAMRQENRPHERPTPRATDKVESAMAAFGGLRERDERELAQFAERFEKNVRHLRRYPVRGVTCYRVYERDCPDVPLIVDRYEDCVHVAEYEREHSRTMAQQADWWARAIAIIARVCEVPEGNVFTKQKHRQRGLSQHERISDEQRTLVAQEGGLRFEVNLTDYVDTGLFLDHRLTRAMFRDQVRAMGKTCRVLNLFCYTGAFTVYAADGGCGSSVSVDLSNTYLSWAQRNLGLNSLYRKQHELVRMDVLEFLHSCKDSERFDLVICDPPTFSNSKSTEEDWQVAQSQAELFPLLRRVLSPQATVYFSNNYRRFKLDEDLLARVGLSAREISRQTIPPEYRNERIHRCWKLRVGEGPQERV